MPEPTYRLLASELREAILGGAFPANQPLPTELGLAESRGLSRQTVRLAFAQLVAEGLVYRVRGRGTFAVATPEAGAQLRSLGTIDDLLALALDTELEVVEPFAPRINGAAAARLQLDEPEVVQGRFLRLRNGEAFSVTDASLPPAIGRRMLDAGLLPLPGRWAGQTLIGAVEGALGIPIAGAHQSVTAEAAAAADAPLIGCAPGDPVLRFDRLYFDRDGGLTELSLTTTNPRRHAYRIELRRAGL